MIATVLIVHHSATGHTRRAAEHVARGAKGAGARVISKPVEADGVPPADAATRDDFRDCDALVLGCPVHQRSVSWEMKRFIDRHCEPAWFWDDMAGRVGGLFTTGGGHGGAGGGAELAQLALAANLASLGLILVTHAKTTPGFEEAGMHWGPDLRTSRPGLVPIAVEDMAGLEAMAHYGATVARVAAALKRGATERLTAIGNLAPDAAGRATRTARDGTTAMGEPR